MTWHYLQEGEEASWHPGSSGGPPLALLKSTHMPGVFSLRGRGMDTWERSRSGMTSEPSTLDLGEGQLTLCLEGSRARTSARRVKVEDLPERVRDFGSTCSASLTKYGLALSSRKTARTCVPVASAPSSKGLPAWGMTHDGACWELGTSARLTSETVCGSWPTPRATDYGRQAPCNAKGRHKTIDAIVRHGPWPTPTTQGNEFCPSMNKWPSHVRMWTDLGLRKGNLARNGGVDPIPLREWMMGWPTGWTALGPLATGKFRQWLRLHGEFSAVPK